MKEYIIENITDQELKRLEDSDLEWYPDDLTRSDICVYGTKKDIDKAMCIIGRE